jgi:ABC-type multidrug transport system ATPase subunit
MNQGIPRRVNAQSLAALTRGVEKRYGRAVALSGLDLTVPAGAFYLLVGPNGAGKSTTLRILLDLVRADAGTAEVLGLDTRRGPAVRARIGWLPEDRNAHYGWQRVDRLMAAHASYYPSWDAEYATHLTRALEIRLDRKYGRLSKGEARRVQLLLTLAHRPELLLLDEPTDGLDPAARELVLGILAEHLVEAPATVIVSTHLVYEMDRLADHLGVLRNGKLVAQLPRAELHQHLLDYQLEVSAGWSMAEHDLALVRHIGNGRELQWLIWGDQREITERLVSTGACVRNVAPVSLEDAAVALLTCPMT